MTSTDLTTTNAAVVTIGDVAERQALAREFMATVMREGIDGDFARIPGCGPKPVLLKPGAEKLARLFNLAIVTEERTMLERIDGEGYVAAYRVALAGPDGRTWGSAEKFAAESEKTFERTPASGAALLNALASRAQKRAFVAAVIQSTGVSDLFGGEALADDLLTEQQRDVVVAIYEAVAPRLTDQVKRQATKVKQRAWSAFLGSALDLAAELKGWSDDDRARAELRLADELATRETVAEVIGVELAEVVEDDAA